MPSLAYAMMGMTETEQRQFLTNLEIRNLKMSDGEFLKWLAERLVNVYNESPNVDFVLKLKEIATKLDDKDNLRDT